MGLSNKLNTNLPVEISKELSNIDNKVWDRGYYHDADDGTWYELYVNDDTKDSYPEIEADFENEESASYNFRGFFHLELGNYKEFGQITFFVPKNESVWTYEEMSNIFA
jgi:hypothetical protein